MRILQIFALIVVAVGWTSNAIAAEGTFDSNGVQIRYVIEGTGEPVVLVHGWMSDSSFWGRDAKGETKLSTLPGFQIIAIDVRGHGKSGKPYDASKYGAEMAQDVVRLLDHLKLKKAHLIGYSMGTYIVAKVAATHPDRVVSCIYGGQAPLLTGEAGSREVDVFAQAVESGKGLGSYIIEVSPPGRKPTLEQANALAQIMFAGKDVKALALAGKSFNGLEVKQANLQKARIPTLFIYGSKEAESTRTRIAKLHKVLPLCEQRVVEGGDHITTVSKPEFGSTIVTFLQAHKKR